jgi:iduronate 2-sulfatase
MGNCFHVERTLIDFIGYSMRTTRYRYTEWLHFNGTILHGDFSRRVGRELYDHEHDDGGNHDFDKFENENVVEDPANAQLVSQLHDMLVKGFPVVQPG